MASTLPLPDRWPMPLTDQHGAAAFAWFPPGTPTDPIHVLPSRVYAEVCRLVEVEPSSPWVEFPDRPAAIAAAAVAVQGEGHREPPAT
jgi:hypothetical protein